MIEKVVCLFIFLFVIKIVNFCRSESCVVLGSMCLFMLCSRGKSLVHNRFDNATLRDVRDLV